MFLPSLVSFGYLMKPGQFVFGLYIFPAKLKIGINFKPSKVPMSFLTTIEVYRIIIIETIFIFPLSCCIFNIPNISYNSSGPFTASLSPLLIRGRLDLGDLLGVEGKRGEINVEQREVVVVKLSIRGTRGGCSGEELIFIFSNSN